MNGVKVLVTGSEGFIGGHLVTHLLEQGCDVVGVDNLSKYGESLERLDTESFEFVHGDAKDASLLVDLMADCDYVIAGAALNGGVGYLTEHAYDLLAENERITAATCDAAIETRRKGGRLNRVTFVSSSMVYSHSESVHVEGNQDIQAPPALAYGFQKLAVERFALAAHAQYGLPYTIVRPFNVVGAGERRGLGASTQIAHSHVVTDLAVKALSGQRPLRILGDGSQTRAYTYVGDLVRGITTATMHPAGENEDFNLSTPLTHTVLDVARGIWERVNPTEPFCYVSDPAPSGDVAVNMPEVSKAARVLGFEADTPLEHVLDEVVAWVRAARTTGLL